jgi:phosphate transport system substrate-binding protein
MFAHEMKAAIALGAIVAGVAVADAAEATVLIDGSSTVYPITEAMAELYREQVDATAAITVGVSGTGGGFSKFCNGETDISNASRAIKPTEVEACAANGIDYLEVRVGTDAVTVVVANDTRIFDENSPGTVEGLTFADLAAIWSPSSERRIRRWRQVNGSWSNRIMSLFGPGTDSGTFDFFTEEVNGEGGASRADFEASEDDNVLVLGIANGDYALGYFGLSYYLENLDKLTALEIEGEPPALNIQDTDGDGAADSFEPNDAYPLSRPLFIYINTDKLATNPDVRSFVQFYLETARDTDIVTEVGYVPAATSIYDAGLAQVN